MEEILNIILQSVVPALLGGGLVMIFTLPEKKGSARLDNAERVLKKYEEIIDRLDKDNLAKDKQIAELVREVNDLKTKLADVSTRMKALQLIEEEDRALRCEKLKCKNRKPKLDEQKLEDLTGADIVKPE